MPPMFEQNIGGKMSQHIGFNTKKAFIKKISFDAKRLSFLYARILFKRYDTNCLDKVQLSKNIIKFDYKNGRFVNFKWITKSGGEAYIKVVRTKKNNIIVFYENIIVDFIMFFYVFVLNILKK